MAHAESSQPHTTELMSTTASRTNTNNTMEDMIKLHEDIGERCVLTIEHVEKTLEQVEQVTLSIGLIRKIQDEMGIRFDARWREMEEKQCSILEALEELSTDLAEEESVVPAPPNALAQLFASLPRGGEKMLAAPKMITQARMATFFNGPTRLLSGDRVPFITKLHTLHDTLKTHWEASQHLDSAMTATYPWLSFAMAACYYLALSAWAVPFAVSLYRYCTMVTLFYKRKAFDLIMLLSHMAIPYTLGSRKPFATLLLALLVLYIHLKHE